MQTERLDKCFQFWFDEDVWPQVPDDGQRRLHELFSKFQSLRHEVSHVQMNYSAGGEWNTDLHPKATLNLPELEKRVSQLHEAQRGLQDDLLALEVIYKKLIDADFPVMTEDAASSIYTSARGMGRAQLPWKLVRIAILSVVFMWVYMVVVIIIEISVGIQSIMKFPGEPPWIRDFKMRTWDPRAQIHFSNDNTLPSNYNLFSTGTASYVGSSYGYTAPGTVGPGGPILLGSANLAASGPNMSFAVNQTFPLGRSLRMGRNLNSDEMALESLLKAIPEVAWIIEQIEESTAVMMQPSLPAFLSPSTDRSFPVSWPPLFEPRHLSCSKDAVVALTGRGLGAKVLLSASVAAEPFSLQMPHGHGPIVGSRLSSAGLQLVLRDGSAMMCGGSGPQEGMWACESEDSMLPLAEEDGLLVAALGDGLAALRLESSPESVLLLQDFEGSGWGPAGEVHLPPGSFTDGSLGLSFQGKELIVTATSGEVLRRHLELGTSTWLAAPGGTAIQREYVAACETTSSGIVRLALRRHFDGDGEVWAPELVVGI